MKRPIINRKNDSGVANLIEYVMISGILMFLLVVMMLLVNATIMQGPSNQLRYTAFTDIGNGVSTRIVDMYIIAPDNGTISTYIDLPEDVAKENYFVTIGQGANATQQSVSVFGGTMTYGESVTSTISLSGIGATRGVIGNTTGMGLKKISYDSGGF